MAKFNEKRQNLDSYNKNGEIKMAITDCWKSCSCCLFKIESYMQSLTTTFSEKYKTSEAKFNEKRQNLDSDSKNGKETYK